MRREKIRNRSREPCMVFITSVTDRAFEWWRERRMIRQSTGGRILPKAFVRHTVTEKRKYDREKRQWGGDEKGQQQWGSNQQTSDSSSPKKWHAGLVTEAALVFSLPGCSQCFPNYLSHSYSLCHCIRSENKLKWKLCYMAEGRIMSRSNINILRFVW